MLEIRGLPPKTKFLWAVISTTTKLLIFSSRYIKTRLTVLLVSWFITYAVTQKVRYEFNYKTKVCKKEALTDTFRPLEIPKNATYVGVYTIGSNAGGGTGVDVVTWAGNFTTSEGVGRCKVLGVWLL